MVTWLLLLSLQLTTINTLPKKKKNTYQHWNCRCILVRKGHETIGLDNIFVAFQKLCTRKSLRVHGYRLTQDYIVLRLIWRTKLATRLTLDSSICSQLSRTSSMADTSPIFSRKSSNFANCARSTACSDNWRERNTSVENEDGIGAAANIFKAELAVC